MPRVSHAAFGPVEADARLVPWSDLARLALMTDQFPPAYRPVTEFELERLLVRAEAAALAGRAVALADEDEFNRLQWLLQRYRLGRNGLVFDGCSCRKYPPRLRLTGRLVGGYSGLGDPVPAEGGLGFVAGHNLAFESGAELALGAAWAAFDFRLGGRSASGGVGFSEADGRTDPLSWPGWARATGRADVRDLRLASGAWTGRFVRALLGVQWGRWSLSAGWDQRRTGPGLSGDLSLDYQGRPFPALTARRTEPFHWSGLMTHLAPDQTLLRAGLLSRRVVIYRDEFGSTARQTDPWFFQWLVGWNVTPWFRTHFTHTVMATAREGTLWPDLLQVNFPLVGTTWREMASGPVTDRIFAAQFEFRWRQAPWPGLPSAAGRLFWDYGGTDFLPSGPGGVVPQISVPASVVGVELVGSRWDVGFEFAELQHEKVLWYSNGGYAEGYTQGQTLLGHPLGGSGKAYSGLVRLRPSGSGLEAALQGRKAEWGMSGLTPGTGQRHSLALVLRRTPGRLGRGLGPGPHALLWEITTEWNREQVDPGGFAATSRSAERDWWRLIFKVGI